MLTGLSKILSSGATPRLQRSIKQHSVACKTSQNEPCESFCFVWCYVTCTHKLVSASKIFTMPQEGFIPIPALAPSLDGIGFASGDWLGSWSQIRSKLQNADEEAEDLVSNYRTVKEECDKVNFEVSICEDHLAKCYATGDLAGALSLEQKREGLVDKQTKARDNMKSALYELEQMARQQHEYRKAIPGLIEASTVFNLAAINFSETIRSFPTLVNADIPKRQGTPFPSSPPLEEDVEERRGCSCVSQAATWP